ncbi:MAG: haloacid dehalogenase [Clostridia bacterium]|nr:haloacid dehalogenase [Clostridia bacterium]
MSRRILFATDLDNTLIHSLRHRREGDVCVEWIDGGEWGYMSAAAVELLRRVREHAEVIPVTTRSIAQYRRIQWPEGLQPGCAVTTNGAVFLQEGASREDWLAGTEAIVAPVRAQLEALTERMHATGDFLRCRMVDGMYAFVYCRGREQAIAVEAEHRDLPGIRCVRSAKKVYFFPEGLDKGAAVARLRQLIAPDHMVCAGDSAIDVPMLLQADTAIAPASAGLGLPEGSACLCTGEDFACDVLGEVLRVCGAIG